MSRYKFLLTVISALLALPVSGALCQAPSLSTSGGLTLTFPTVGTAHAVQITDGSNLSVSDRPVRVFVCSQSSAGNQCSQTFGPGTGTGNQTSYYAGYGTVTSGSGNTIIAVASVTTINGTTFTITDTYSIDGANSFTLSRSVQVSAGNANDYAYNTEFAMGLATTTGTDQGDFNMFAPSRWYGMNQNSAGENLVADPTYFGTQPYFYWRETESALPVMMQQDPKTNEVFSVAHTSDSVAAGDDSDPTSTSWNVFPSVQYGAIGNETASVGADGAPVLLGFFYPDEHTILNAVNHFVWQGRSDTITSSSGQSYVLTLSMQNIADFNTAVQSTFDLNYPKYHGAGPNYGIVMSKVYAANMSNIDDQFLKYDPPKAQIAAYGIPFNVDDVFDPITVQEDPNEAYPATMRMGGTGQQAPLGYLFYRDYLLNGSAVNKGDGVNVLNFWVNAESAAHTADSKLPSGMVLTDFNATGPNTSYLDGSKQDPNGPCQEITMRSMTDGMIGLMNAAVYGRKNADTHASWETLLNQFGDWLVGVQTSDGHFSRIYTIRGLAGTAANFEAAGCSAGSLPSDLDTNGDTTKFSFAPIRYLVTLASVTQSAAAQASYLKAARAAGMNAETENYNSMNYIGGIENNLTIDKEAGEIALDAAMALYDFDIAHKGTSLDDGRSAQWLKDAQNAANYVMSWTYYYNFPIVDATAPVAKCVVTDNPSCPGPDYPDPGDQREHNADAGHRYWDYVTSGPRVGSFISIGGAAIDISQSFESFSLFRLSVATSSSFSALLASPYYDAANRSEVNSKMSTQLNSSGLPYMGCTTNPPSACDPNHNQYFGYEHLGFVTEATQFSNMYFDPTDTPHGDIAWLADAELDPLVRLYETYSLGNQHYYSISGLVSAAESGNYSVLQNANPLAPWTYGWTSDN